MLYTIVNDQPFQVLSDSFTISPSESGYELYLSADGVNYSQFITVPSGVTKQMVDMNNGNFYRLMGNTSIVTVNWSRDCCGGGSGGGGVAGVSSLNGQTGALTTKTINGNDILGTGDITIEGGSSKQDYIIVDALSDITEPYEGLTAFVKPGNTLNTLSGYTFSIEGLNGEGEVYYHSGYRTIYRFDGQGGAEIRDEAQGYAYIQLTSEYQYFDNRIYVKIENGTVYSTLAATGLYYNTGALENISLTETTIDIPIPYNGNIYRYEQGRWNNIECLWIDDSASQDDLASSYGVLYGFYTAYASNKEMLSRILSTVRVNRYPALSIGKEGTSLIISFLENNTSLCVMRLYSNGGVNKNYYSLSEIKNISLISFGNNLSLDVDTDVLYRNGEAMSTGSTYPYIFDYGIVNYVLNGEFFANDLYIGYYGLKLISGGAQTGIMCNPSISKTQLPEAVTIDGNEYIYDFAFDYGSVILRAYCNYSSMCTNFRAEHRKETVKYLTEDTWPGAYWEIGTEVPGSGVWGASIRRPDNTEIFETYNRQGDVVVMGEGNIPNTGSIEGNLTITDENEHIMLDGQGNRYVFRMDFSNGRLYFYHSPEQVGNFVYKGAQGTQHTTGETSGTVHIELAKVLSGDSWVQKDEMLFPKTYYIDNMTTEERVALYNLIRYSGPKVSPISKFCRFFSQITDKDGFMGMCEVYFCRFDTNLSFSGNAMSRNSDALIKVSFNLTSDGNIDGKTVTEYSLSEKVVSISQSDYDALVQAGTVDANTLYVII